MNCGKCGLRSARVHLTCLEGGVVRELHLCEDCARENEPRLIEPAGLPLKERLKGLKRMGPEPEKLKDEILRCPYCSHVNPEDWNFCSACGAMREPGGEGR